MDRLDAYARCPFYRGIKKGQRGGKIECTEGPLRARTTLTFRRTRDLDNFFECRCCGDYEKCPVCRLIMENYEE